MLSNQTIRTLRDLKLYGMADALEQQLTNPDTYDLEFEERLGLLVDCELAARDTRRLQRLLTAARLRQDACVEDINYRHKRGLDKRQMQQLARCDWIRAANNLLVTGATGTGKTWLTCAISNAACRQGLSVLYVRCGRLLEELRIAHATGGFARRLGQLARVDLLVLDDWGLQKLASSERNDLLEVLEDRSGKRSTAVTSQVPVESWHEVVGSPTLADAILDRLLSNAHRLKLTGETLRPSRPVPFVEESAPQ
jgi:DNA replication protein DnaC